MNTIITRTFAPIAILLFPFGSATAQEAPTRFQPVLDVYKAAAQAECADTDGGDFDMNGGVIYAADFNNDGITDPIIDTHGLHCSTSATLYGGGSGGWAYDVFISEGAGYQHYSFMAHSSTVVLPGVTPVLLLTQHGSECDVSGVCYQAYFWVDGMFRSADKIAEPVN